MQRIIVVASELAIITGHNKYETINKAIDTVLNRSKIVKKHIPKSKVEEKLLSLSENDPTGFQAYPDYHNKLFSKIIYQKREFHSNQLIHDKFFLMLVC